MLSFHSTCWSSFHILFSNAGCLLQLSMILLDFLAHCQPQYKMVFAAYLRAKLLYLLGADSCSQSVLSMSLFLYYVLCSEGHLSTCSMKLLLCSIQLEFELRLVLTCNRPYLVQIKLIHLGQWVAACTWQLTFLTFNLSK